MSTLVLPLRADLTDYEFDVLLDGAQYTFRVRWQDFDSSWYISIFDGNGDPIAQGRRVVVNWPLVTNFGTLARVEETDGAGNLVVDGQAYALTGEEYNGAMPPGLLVAIDTSGQKLDPGEGELGSRVIMLYVEEDAFV